MTDHGTTPPSTTQIFEDPPDHWNGRKLVVVAIITLVIAFGILDFISNIGLRAPR